VQPRGRPSYPFIPSVTWGVKDKSSKPLIITEGPVKALALMQAGAFPVALGGVWNGTIKADGDDEPIRLAPELQSFELYGRTVYLAFDADYGSNFSVRQALLRLYLALYYASASVRLLRWPASSGKGIDDYLVKLAGTEAEAQAKELSKLLASAACVHEVFGEEDLELVRRELKRAKLFPLQLTQLTKLFANRLAVPVVALREATQEKNQGEFERSFELADSIEPWPDPVDGELLLGDLCTIVRDHVVIEANQILTTSLWIILTYVHEWVNYLPILSLISPEKRCGKTTLIDVLERLVRKPLSTVNISPAALFRAVDRWCPTVLIDEGELLLTKENEDLRRIVNSGHTRGKFAVVCNPNTLEPECFRTFSPKVIAAIRKLPETIIDRLLVISMQRRRKSDTIKKLSETNPESFASLRRKLWRWRLDHGDNLSAHRSAQCAYTASMGDRAADNWTELLMIAQEIGEQCHRHAIQAAGSSEQFVEDDEDALTIYLLNALQKIFQNNAVEVTIERPTESFIFLPTSTALELLNQDKEAPWADWKNGLTPHKLRHLLSPFEVKPVRARIGKDDQVRGYRLGQLEPAFQRYLSAPKS